MKTLLPTVLALLLVIALPTLAKDKPEAAPVVAQVQVYFSPKGGCTEVVIEQIDAAKTEILVKTYSFTSVPIAKALVDAHKKGVKIVASVERTKQSI